MEYSETQEISELDSRQERHEEHQDNRGKRTLGDVDVQLVPVEFGDEGAAADEDADNTDAGDKVADPVEDDPEESDL